MLQKYFTVALCFFNIFNFSYNKELLLKEGVLENLEVDFQETDVILKPTSHEKIEENVKNNIAISDLIEDYSEHLEGSNIVRINENNTSSKLQGGCSCDNGECIEKNGKDVCHCPNEYGLLSATFCKACECGKDSNCTFESYGFLNLKTRVICICKEGYQAENEKCIGPCTQNPCNNGGTCVDTDKGYKCDCASGFIGMNCTNKVTCENGGSNECKKIDQTCVDSPDSQAKGYTCKPCDPNMIIDDKGTCILVTCENGGSNECKKIEQTCVDSPDSQEKGYTCIPCDPNMIIDDKGTCILECECEYGMCRKNSEGFVQCFCLPEFGKYTEHECKACECGKGYNCTFDVGFFNDDKYCLCPYGQEINQPCKEIDACTSKPCQNNGQCSVVGNSYRCKCKSPWNGINCTEDACTSNPCHNNGECSVVGNSYKCQCKSPWSGINCTEDPCKRNPCENGGICQFEKNALDCYCKAPYTGKMCEKGPCTGKPCHNNGTCIVDEYSFKCECKTPYTGETCKEGPCTRNPCHNNGTCIVDGYSFKCACKTPYTGDTCKEGPCSRNPCHNNGTCYVDGYFYKCACNAPYTGQTCKEGPCTRNPCFNDGLCIVDGYTFKCICKSSYYGRLCQKDICSRKTCINGQCEVLGDDYYCRCEEGFTGRHCNERIQFKTRDTKLTIVITVFCGIIACFLFAIVCLILRRHRMDK